MAPSLFSSPVGYCRINKKHDVAVLQAAFKGVKNPGEQRGDGTWWPGQINGMYTPDLEKAIAAFQGAHNISGNQGCIHPGDATEQKLVQLLPAERKHLGCFPDSAEVYCFNPQGRIVTGSEKALEDDPDIPEALARSVRDWMRQFNDKNPRPAIGAAKTIRGGNLELTLKLAPITLLDINGNRLSQQGISVAERRIAAGISTHDLQKFGQAQVLPGPAGLVIEMSGMVFNQIGDLIDSVLNSGPFKALVGVISGFSASLSRQLTMRLETDITDLKRQAVTSASGWKAALAQLKDFAEKLTHQTLREIQGVATSFARAMKREISSTTDFVRKMVGEDEGGSPILDSDSQQHRRLAEWAEKLVRQLGLNPAEAAQLANKFGRRFFLFSIAISAWNIFSSDNWGRAAGKEALTLFIDVGATALGVAAVVVFGGPAVLAIAAGAAVGLAASFAFDGIIDDILDFATGELSGPIVKYA